MGTDIEKLVDLIIQERMQSQYSKWREEETGKEKKEDFIRLETEYEEAISALSEEQKTLCGIIVILSSIPAQRVNVSFTGWD